MKKIKQVFSFFILAIILIPQVTFASWWNPLTWKIFKKRESAPQIQVLNTEKEKTQEEKISELQKQLNELKNKEKATVNATQKQTTSTTKKETTQEVKTLSTANNSVPKPTTFTLPSGAVIDSNGNLIKPAPMPSSTIVPQSNSSTKEESTSTQIKTNQPETSSQTSPSVESHTIPSAKLTTETEIFLNKNTPNQRIASFTITNTTTEGLDDALLLTGIAIKGSPSPEINVYPLFKNLKYYLDGQEDSWTHRSSFESVNFTIGLNKNMSSNQTYKVEVYGDVGDYEGKINFEAKPEITELGVHYWGQGMWFKEGTKYNVNIQ